ncbi:pentaheme c-type cytochrome TorC [Halomonas sp. M20]|uniref:pentaheme c-type cytochrome TorC n=1 Tax=Halomonas sp. M20 TaxID=2763264 RepID=UPI001D0B0F2F|nr:pentaheme c-type cytochrome TorC [Halomonas sp. M20]
MGKLMKNLWRVLKRPPVHIGLGVIVLFSFIGGIVFWGGFNTALEVTNTEEFCVSCHEMGDNVYQELQTTVHWENRTGVRATCPDCHVPHNWTDKIARKMQASKEVWGAIFGTIDTREKFLDKRLELAQHEWERFSANKSLECRNCHDYDSMDWDAMSDEAARFMKRAAEKNQSCLDCHKGIAHELPKQMNFKNPMLARLEQQAQGVGLDEGETYYTVKPVTLYVDEALTERAGVLESASEVTILEAQGDKFKLAIDEWRKAKGFGRVLYEDFGQNITSAVLEKETAQNEALFTSGEEKIDDLTGLPWVKVEAQFWTDTKAFLSSRDELWNYASETYGASCSICHTEPAPAHFDTNTWPAMFAGMVGFTNMDAQTQDLVLKYLQKHSSDYAGEH